MKWYLRPRRRAFVVAGVLASGAAFSPMAYSQAQTGPTCDAPWRVDQTLANGARWQMCWERRDREGIVLHDIFYTTRHGVTRRVLSEAAIAQIHVPYDDNLARYHDVSDYGLGTNTHLSALSQGECPGGQLLNDGNRNVVCRINRAVATEGILGSQATVESELVLFSVSHVGAYNYIPQWTFHDDGTIEPAMGATGRLQRYRSDERYGWSINTGTNHVGVSHLHNYYWKLDFDLGDDGTNDVVEEINVIEQPNGTRETVITPITSETARKYDPQKFRTWRVRDTAISNATGNPISYEIISLDTGHGDVGPAYEAWTHNDVYVTRARSCERFASRNPADSLGGCAASGNVATFTNGENLVSQDKVVWVGLSFHHIPRDEDEPHMHAHWNRFEIRPRDWTRATTPLPQFEPVVITESFEGTHGWVEDRSPGSSTVAGRWEVGAPQRTANGSGQLQPGLAPEGSKALVTGPQAGVGPSSFDVDMYWTRARSPVIDVPAGSSASINLWWFFAHNARADGIDRYQIFLVSSAGRQRLLSVTGRRVHRRGRWRPLTADISQHMGRQAKLIVIAVDGARPSIVEAGLDAVTISVEQ